MKNKKIFKIGLIYFTAMVLIAIIFTLGYMGKFKNEILTTLLIQVMVMFAIPLLMYTLLVSKNLKKSFADCGFKKISGKIVLISFVLGVVLFLINTFVANFFATVIKFFGYDSLQTSSVVNLDYKFLLKEFVFSAILPGVCEETLHRGIVLHAGKKTGNPRYCLIISSILFGMMHMNINQFFYATILGFLMGYVALISDSIYPSIIIHFMNNFLNTYLFYGPHLNLPLATYISKLEALLMSSFVIYVVTVTLGIIGLIYAYKYLTRKIVKIRAKAYADKIVNELQIENLPIEEAQEKISIANDIISKSENANMITNVPKGRKYTFVETLFFISSLIMGSIITIVTFIWGII